jgi:hypothetical protein
MNRHQYRCSFATNGFFILRTADGAPVRTGSIIVLRRNPDQRAPQLMRTQAVGPGGVQQWQLAYREGHEPTNDQLVMFGRLPVENGRTLRPFAECFPHLVRYTDDTADKIVIVREPLDGEMIVLYVVPVTALARQPLENIFDQPVAPAAFGREIEALQVAPAAFDRELEAPPVAPAAIGQARRW